MSRALPRHKKGRAREDDSRLDEIGSVMYMLVLCQTITRMAFCAGFFFGNGVDSFIATY